MPVSRETRNEYMRNYMREWRIRNPDKASAIDRRAKKKFKIRVYTALGGAACASCGQTDDRTLEINHKNGGGGKEYGRLGWKVVMLRVLKHPADYNVLCRVCNAADYLKRVFGVSYKIEPLTGAAPAARELLAR